MLRALDVRAAGTWAPPAVDTVRLSFDDRHRRRIRLTGTAGTQFLLDLSEAVVLRNGDGLMLEDGRVISVEAADEDVLEVRGTDTRHLLCLVWHLGNRHLPTEVRADRLVIRADDVIAEMLHGLGAEVTAMRAPFDPESGAYSHGHAQP